MWMLQVSEGNLNRASNAQYCRYEENMVDGTTTPIDYTLDFSEVLL